MATAADLSLPFETLLHVSLVSLVRSLAQEGPSCEDIAKQLTKNGL